MVYEFEGEIKLLEGKMKWKVVYFPYSVQEAFHTNSRIPVHIDVGGHEFEHTLLPSRNGHYFVYNEFIRRAVRKELGDMLHVTLTQSVEPRAIVVPAYIKEVLEEHQMLSTFLDQPDYLKREQINYIELAKKEETRSNRSLALAQKLHKSL
ncbi:MULTISPECIES: YdeI/OmpD-associated family protein [unclassified Paenibacillus]|uniref:YdeI/OmpD-associated family protein n=2 Tax=Paenibacillus TaxID=44249 RepID=UPI0003E286F1|nr:MULTISPECIES: YdeI/OmpD-associated family protein [unclassified Paenibacillus]ETT48208.1 hypothetical protein C162_15105 [Paenibacillus sp. FSL R7-269]OMF93499.1 hypothetical protein BK147_17375 [Paenibacillus sp. FSL R7-0337]